MKWDISRERNLFDDMKENMDFEISENVDVNVSNIKNTIFAEINKDKKSKSKKHISKKFVLSLIAATLGTALLFTVTVGATGGFNSILSEHFAGDDINGVYSGGNVELSTADKYTAEFAGIAGNDHEVETLIKIRNKDGSPFVENLENTFVRVEDYDDIVDSYYISSENTGEELAQIPDWNGKINTSAEVNTQNYILNIKDTTFDKIMNNFSGNSAEHNNERNFNINFENESTINLNVYYHRHSDDRSIKGKDLEISQNEIYIYHVEKVIYSYNIREYEEKYKDFEKLWKVTSYERGKAEYENAKYIKENQVITSYKDGCNFYLVIAEKTRIPVDLSLSVTLNYKNSMRSINPAKETFKNNDTNYNVSYIESTPFGTSITFAAGTSNLDELFARKWLGNNVQDNKIIFTLKNGQKVKGIIPVGSSVTNLGWVGYEGMYDVITDDSVLGARFTIKIYYEDDNGKWLTINPSEITSININGNTITES